ncbi:AAA family ATPase [Melaminivora sp.]|uniref:AAA family ATPase n=1 Tax=Melaminivora sp. TaxID=1933032 RepID=UPI0028AF4804|nr:AAA family ATPase [Melaminivora sp.]
MYAPFFGLQHPPFSIAPDPRYLFMSERHREALAHLLYGLDAGGGFVLLTGEVGTGKTTVCRCFLEQVPATCHVAYIFNPRLTAIELLRSVCEEFGVEPHAGSPGATTAKDCIDPLNAFLLQAHAAGRTSVLVIDEAQNLAPEVLEQLRLLTNLETSERKLLQIILIGQPELRDMVARPGLEQLAQRIIARYHLGPLSRAETAQYVAHRLAVAGQRGPLPFAPAVLARIHALAGGVPRRINLLCDRALLGAYSQGEREVRPATLRRAAREVAGDGAARGAGGRLSPTGGARRHWQAGTAGLLLGAAAAFGAVWAAGAWPGRIAGPSLAAGAAPAAAPAAEGQSLTLAQWLAAPAGSAAGQEPDWGRLARLWQAEMPEARGIFAAPGGAEGEAGACAALALMQLRCWHGRDASLDLLRQLDRPTLLGLQAPGQAAPRWALLRSLGADTAVLVVDNSRTLALPLAELAPLWHGEAATLWRAPAELPASGDVLGSAAAAQWLDDRLARAAGPAAPRPAPGDRRARIHAFQKAQGLTADGLAGPLTLMRLNRATGVPEPRLQHIEG